MEATDVAASCPPAPPLPPPHWVFLVKSGVLRPTCRICLAVLHFAAAVHLGLDILDKRHYLSMQEIMQAALASNLSRNKWTRGRYPVTVLKCSGPLPDRFQIVESTQNFRIKHRKCCFRFPEPVLCCVNYFWFVSIGLGVLNVFDLEKHASALNDSIAGSIHTANNIARVRDCLTGMCTSVHASKMLE